MGSDCLSPHILSRPSGAAALFAGWALCGHNPVPALDVADPTYGGSSRPDAAQPTECQSVNGTRLKLPESAQENGQTSLSSSDSGADSDSCRAEPRSRVGSSIPRAERRSIGLMCKQLLDCGRLLWLRQQGFEVCRLLTKVAASVAHLPEPMEAPCQSRNVSA